MIHRDEIQRWLNTCQGDIIGVNDGGLTLHTNAGDEHLDIGGTPFPDDPEDEEWTYESGWEAARPEADPPLPKTGEIELLQRLTAQARLAGAEYLYAALVALAVPFENAIRSDFPGELAAADLQDSCRALREDIAALRAEAERLNGEIAAQRESLARGTRQLASIREHFRNAAAAAESIGAIAGNGAGQIDDLEAAFKKPNN